jgi:hypothetical protein
MESIQVLDDDVVFTIFNDDGTIQGLPTGDKFIVLFSEGPQGVPGLLGPEASQIFFQPEMPIKTTPFIWIPTDNQGGVDLFGICISDGLP